MRWLRLVGIAVLQLPFYGGSWLMTVALVEDKWGWQQVADGVAFGVLVGGFDAVRRGRRGQRGLRRDQLARHVRRGSVPADQEELARLVAYVRRQRRQWHPFWLTALVLGAVAAGGFGWAAAEGGRPRLWGALLLLCWAAAALVVELVNLSRQSRMERLLGVEAPRMRLSGRSARLTADGPSVS